MSAKEHADKIERFKKRKSKLTEKIMELEREQNKEVESYPRVLSVTANSPKTNQSLLRATSWYAIILLKLISSQCFIGVSMHSKTIEALGLRPPAFISFSRVWKPNETLALVSEI